MGETSYEIERRIRETRENLSENFSELEEKVKTAVDWRAQFEEHTGAMLAIAFGGGVLASALFPGGRRSSRDFLDDIDHTPSYRDVPGTTGATSAFSESEDRGYSESWASDNRKRASGNRGQASWDALKGALVAVAADRVTGYINEFLPGFKEELTKAKNRKRAESFGSTGPSATGWEDTNRSRSNYAE